MLWNIQECGKSSKDLSLMQQKQEQNPILLSIFFHQIGFLLLLPIIITIACIGDGTYQTAQSPRHMQFVQLRFNLLAVGHSSIILFPTDQIRIYDLLYQIK